MGTAAILTATCAALSFVGLAHADRAHGGIVGSHAIVVRGLGVPAPVTATSVTYRSTDGHGNPVVDTATVIVPDLAWPGPGPRPLVTYQEAEDSLGPQCGPSSVIARGDLISADQLTLETPMIAAMLLHRWAVVLPDFEGPHGLFGDRLQAAHAVLDGLRATLRLPGFSARTPVAAYGYSGGASATLWAAEQQPRYAPDLRLVGVVSGGTPYHTADMMARLNGGSRSAFDVLTLLALVRDHPQLRPLLNRRGLAELAADRNACAIDLARKYPNQNLDAFTVAPHVWRQPLFRAAAAAEEPGQAIPAAPVLEYHSTNDEVAPAAAVDQLVARYRAAGATVVSAQVTGPDHDLTPVVMMPTYLHFLTTRFAQNR